MKKWIYLYANIIINLFSLTIPDFLDEKNSFRN